MVQLPVTVYILRSKLSFNLLFHLSLTYVRYVALLILFKRNLSTKSQEQWWRREREKRRERKVERESQTSNVFGFKDRFKI